MRFFGVVLAAVALILPSFAAGQAAPLPAPGGADDLPPVLWARGPAGPGPVGPPPGRMAPGPGAWWKDSEVVRKLDLSEAQVGQIEQTYLQYRLRLVDLRADLEKQELGLQPLLDAGRPEEAKVAAQIDLITAARGRLEKEHALMLLAIRRVLSTEQWKRLQALQQGDAGRPGTLTPAARRLDPPRRRLPGIPNDSSPNRSRHRSSARGIAPRRRGNVHGNSRPDLPEPFGLGLAIAPARQSAGSAAFMGRSRDVTTTRRPRRKPV